MESKDKFKEYIGKYIGEKAIESISISKDKTYLGKIRVVVDFGKGDIETFPEEILKSIVTKEKSDPTTLREARVLPVVEKILTILTEAELSIDDVGYATGPKLMYSIQDSFSRAIGSFFGKVFNVNSFNGKVTLKDLDNVLRIQK